MYEQIADKVAAVAVEIANGDELSTTEIAHEKKTAVTTVFRWVTRGLPTANGGRVRLEALKRGRKWLTSRAALRRFFSALPTNTTDPSTSRSDGRSPTAQQIVAIDAKEQLRERYGIV